MAKVWRVANFRYPSFGPSRPGRSMAGGLLRSTTIGKAPRSTQGGAEVKMSVTFETSREMQQMLRSGGKSINGSVKEANFIHREMAQTVRLSVLEEYNIARRSLPSGRDSRRPERKFEKALGSDKSILDTISPAARGFIVDFERLDQLVTDRNGFPYWRSVEYGFRPFEVKGGLFYSSPTLGGGGKFSAPGANPTGMDPRLPQNMRKGMTFTISGFEGYGVIEPTLLALRSEFKKEFLERIMDSLPPGFQQALEFIGAGGRQVRGGPFVVPGMSGFQSDPRK